MAFLFHRNAQETVPDFAFGLVRCFVCLGPVKAVKGERVAIFVDQEVWPGLEPDMFEGRTVCPDCLLHTAIHEGKIESLLERIKGDDARRHEVEGVIRGAEWLCTID
jgi:hypothetical protein